MVNWQQTLRQGMRFGWVGGLATLTHVSLYDLLVRYGNLDAVLANVLAFLLAFLVSFFGHYFWTFRDQRSVDPGAFHRSLLRFFAVALAGLALNSFFVYLVVDVFGSPHTMAIFFMVLVVPGLLFLLNKFWAFAAMPASATK